MNFEANEKENLILSDLFSLCLSLNQYMNDYFENYNYSSKVLIDMETIRGKLLYKNIQKFADSLEIVFILD
jgi:hypothetical protein